MKTEESSSFTPDEWKFAGGRNGNEATVYVMRYVAGILYDHVNIATVRTDDLGYGNDTTRANARLISSAPDMYNALKVIATNEKLREIFAKADPMALKQIDEAIAKASK